MHRQLRRNVEHEIELTVRERLIEDFAHELRPGTPKRATGRGSISRLNARRIGPCSGGSVSSIISPEPSIAGVTCSISALDGIASKYSELNIVGSLTTATMSS
jgi:hypothetical protein